MSRLNDTAALVRSGPSSEGSKTVSVRKIDNGYIESTSYWNDKTGDYKSSEKFTKTPGGEADDGKVGCETLSDTKKYLGSDV